MPLKPSRWKSTTLMANGLSFAIGFLKENEGSGPSISLWLHEPLGQWKERESARACLHFGLFQTEWCLITIIIFCSFRTSAWFRHTYVSSQTFLRNSQLSAWCWRTDRAKLEWQIFFAWKPGPATEKVQREWFVIWAAFKRVGRPLWSSCLFILSKFAPRLHRSPSCKLFTRYAQAIGSHNAQANMEILSSAS